VKRIEKTPAILKQVLYSQLFGILATQGKRFPHTTIVSFISADNLQSLVFFTPKATRKMNFLKEHAAVALFVDNRSNSITDLQTVAGIEAQGNAAEVPASERQRYEKLYLRKYPELESFVTSPGNAMVKIDVDAYNIVQHFQDVTILEMKRDL